MTGLVLEAPLVGHRLMLRAPCAADAPRIAALMDDWEVAKQTAALPYPYSIEQAETYVGYAHQAAEAGVELSLVIERTRDRVLVGSVGAIIDQGVAELGYWIGREYWGHHYAVEASAVLLDHLREHLAIREAIAETFVNNLRSRRVLELLGFACEGEAEKDCPARGGPRMICHYRLKFEEPAR